LAWVPDDGTAISLMLFPLVDGRRAFESVQLRQNPVKCLRGANAKYGSGDARPALPLPRDEAVDSRHATVVIPAKAGIQGPQGGCLPLAPGPRLSPG